MAKSLKTNITEEEQNSEYRTPAQLREDYYINCLTIEFGGELITFDKARELYGSYLATGETEKTDYLHNQMVKVRAEAREKFPDKEELEPPVQANSETEYTDTLQDA